MNPISPMTKLYSIEIFVGGSSQANFSKMISKKYSKTQTNIQSSDKNSSNENNSGYYPSPFASPKKGQFKQITSKYAPTPKQNVSSPKYYGESSTKVQKTIGNLRDQKVLPSQPKNQGIWATFAGMLGCGNL